MNLGNIDRTFEDAQFLSPQGVVFRYPNLFYIADTENHAIREVTNLVAYILEPCVEFVISVGFFKLQYK
jgi:hypothetical protein